jgi:hypothetical protein
MRLGIMNNILVRVLIDGISGYLMTPCHLVTSRSRVLPWQSNNHSAGYRSLSFKETERSLPVRNQPLLAPTLSRWIWSHLYGLFLSDPFWYYTLIYSKIFQVPSIYQVIRPTFCIHPSCVPFMLHLAPILHLDHLNDVSSLSPVTFSAPCFDNLPSLEHWRGVHFDLDVVSTSISPEPCSQEPSFGKHYRDIDLYMEA